MKGGDGAAGRRQADNTGFSRSARKGFTLVEAVAALLVFTVAFGGALAVVQRAFLELDSARAIMAAGTILQSEMEKERMFTWAQAADTTYTPTVDSGTLRDPAMAGRFTLTRTVTPMAGREARMLQITLTASWRTIDGKVRSRKFTTYYNNGGLREYIARAP
jgi:Tfp pilus assembly protein PilV